MKRIFLAGSYHGNNKGDEIIFYSFMKIIKGINKKNKITIPTTNPDYFQENYRVNTVNPINIIEVIKEIKKSDILILGGGGLLFDYNIIDTLQMRKKSQILYWLILSWLSKIMHKRVYWISLGAGPVNTKFSKFLLKKTSGIIDGISLRDSDSLRLMQDINPEIKAIESRDIVFNLNFKPVKQKGPKTILIIPRYWEEEKELLVKNYTKLIRILLKKGYAVKLSETSHKQEGHFNLTLNSKFKKNKNFKYIPIKKLNLKEFLKIIENSSFVISMRMHANIIASLYHIPSFAIEHKTPKIREVINNLGLPENNFKLAEWDDEKILNSLLNYDKDKINMVKELEDIKKKSKIDINSLKDILKE